MRVQHIPNSTEVVVLCPIARRGRYRGRSGIITGFAGQYTNPYSVTLHRDTHSPTETECFQEKELTLGESDC